MYLSFVYLVKAVTKQEGSNIFPGAPFSVSFSQRPAVEKDNFSALLILTRLQLSFAKFVKTHPKTVKSWVKPMDEAYHTKKIHLFCNYKNWCEKYKSNSNSTENMGPCLKLIPTKYVTVKRVKRETYCHNGAKKLHKVQSKRTFIAL